MKVIVTDYNPEWPEMFEAEAAKLKDVFGDELVAIHHIGSTSVPGIKAKPIIDIMPLVKDIEKVDLLNNRMIELGYEPMGELGIPGRRYFRKGGDDRTHQVHAFQVDSGEIERHLAFRDYLRAHPDEAARYGEIKAQVAKEFPNDIEGYSAGKDAFVKAMEQKALIFKRRDILSNPTGRKISFGVQTPQEGTDYETIKTHWLEAEKLGYDSVWLDDHLFSTTASGWRQAQGECYIYMAALAQATSTIRFGTLVGCNSYRNPALLVKMVSTLDQVSNGRFEFGIGAGNYAFEYEAFGYEFPKASVRLAMLGETLEIYKRMMTEELPSFEGKYYRIKEAMNNPGPAQKPYPPIWIGGTGEQITLKLVAKYADKWNAGGSVEEFERRHKLLKQYCDEIGRDAKEIETTWFGNIFIDEDESRVRSRIENRAKAVNMTVDEFMARRMAGTPDQIISKMKEYIDVGVTYFCPMLGRVSDLRATRLLAQTVIPAFR